MDLLAEIDPAEEEGYARAIKTRQASSRQSFKQKESEYRNNEKIIRALNLPPTPPEPEPFLYRIFDTLDTGGQFVRGVGAKFLGHKDYKDLGIIDAGLKGDEQDITTGALLRENEFFKKHSVLRGATGFIGDVITDPLNYLTFGAGALGKKIGGKAVSNKALKTISGEALDIGSIVNRRAERILAEKLSGEEGSRIARLVSSGVADEPKAQIMRDILKFEANKEAAQPVADLAMLTQKTGRDFRKGLGSLKDIDSVTADIAKTADNSLRERIASELGTTTDQLDLVFKPKAVRFAGVFSNAPWASRIPLLGTSETEIPVVSKITEKLYDALDTSYYGAKQRVGTAIAKGLEQNPDSAYWKTADYVGRQVTKLGRVPYNITSLVSKRAATSGEVFGGRAPLENIQEYERARGALVLNGVQEADMYLGWTKDLLGDAGDEGKQIYTDISRTLQSGLKLVNKTGDIKARNLEVDENLFQSAAAALQSKYEAIKPGAGVRAKTTLLEIRKRFSEMAAKERQAGVLNSALEGYLPQIHQRIPGMKDDIEEFRPLIDGFRVGGSDLDFSLERVFLNLEDAKRHNFIPDEDIRTLFSARLIAHNQAMAEKDFSERFAMYWATPKPLYDRIKQVAVAGTSAQQRAATQYLVKADLNAPIGEAVKDVNKSIKGLITDSGGNALTPTGLDALKRYVFHDRVFADQHGILKEMRSTSDTSKLSANAKYALDIENELDRWNLPKFADESRWKDIEANHKQAYINQENAIKAIPGRTGEEIFTRAGGRELDQFTKKRILKAITSQDDQMFFEGVIPNKLADSIEDAFHTRDAIQSLHGSLEKWGVQEPEKHVLSRLLRSTLKVTQIQKGAATIIWPAFHMRNVGSAFFQGLQSASTLGEALSVPRVLSNISVLRNNADLITNTGKVISAGEVKQGLARANIRGGTFLADFWDTSADMIDSLVSDTNLSEYVPGFNKLIREKKSKSLLSKVPLADKGWQKYKSFVQRLEAFGREHVYMNLLRKGHDHVTAGNLTNKLLVDYAYGKTPFERNILNNVFFFYTFSRNNASQQFMNMLVRPGALTTQLHARNEIAEMLVDPETIQAPDDPEERVRSRKLDEMMAIYIGKNKKTGLPSYASGFGAPIEDVAKYISIVTPNKPTVAGVLDSFGDSAQRTAMLMASQTNPIIRGILEYTIANKNFYFNRPLTDETLRKIPKWERDVSKLAYFPTNIVPNQVWKTLDRVTQDALNARDNGDGTFTIDPTAMAVINYVVPGLSRFLATRSNLTAPGRTGAQKALKSITGLSINEVDLEKSKAFDRFESQKTYMNKLAIPTSKRKARQLLEFSDRPFSIEEEP